MNDTNQVTSREALEATLWELTEWRGAAERISQLLDAIDVYVDERINALATNWSADDRGDATTRTSDGPIVVQDGERLCRACLVPKPTNDFTRDKNAYDGYMIRCKRCVRDKRRSVSKQLLPELAR